jgi:uncharacterized membrane protein YbhN (UPF0104 family)
MAGSEAKCWMSTIVASDLDSTSAPRGRGAGKLAIFAAKLLVTGACFWYISRQIEWGQVLSAIPQLDFRWAGLATVVAMLEIPLLGLRWRNIVDVLVAPSQRVTRPAMIAATAVGMFFGPLDLGSFDSQASAGSAALPRWRLWFSCKFAGSSF